jgi:outer membrane biogenesis lipoprotein LolB
MNKLLTMAFAAALLTACAAPVSNERNEKTVFVTSERFNGNIGDLKGADEMC